MESNLIFSDEPIFIKNGISDWSLIDGNIFEILLSSFPNSKIVKDINIDKSTDDEVLLKDFLWEFKNSTNNIASWSWQPFLDFDDKHNLYKLPQSLDNKNINRNVLTNNLLSPWIVFSSKSMVCNLHKDMFELPGLVCQLYGTKEFIIINHEQDKLKYELESKYYSEHELSQLGLDYIKYIMEPGDFLYFPSNWYHQARSISNSVTFVHSVLTTDKINDFMSSIACQLPEVVQRLSSNIKKDYKSSNCLHWWCQGFYIYDEYK
ncbi:cupin-like domain-containing protein [Vibrio parahaemolyticus]|uniref:cupin-like domain-containing protein n=1 Tax=Vibrio parahaemolyticus TaxID=670 RepID=UPI00084A80AD|nr:cupin-like domain-containing protein [Vibrio parahaemolyticus]EGQ7856002.1 hypothetical protein [Vibrio parahaemolyticus]MDF4713736.1 cupin domain-containing protein [Vibrio parahaemolyticus]ODX85168.1 hypothetical protein BBM92_14290 [Vibrio parahaemolyticus]ODY08690.1 hypothetical protein BBM15_21085 [Vibrio parahaemolyticus]